jgi:hypothetical protein
LTPLGNLISVTNKKIGIRKIAVEIDFDGSYPFNLQISSSTKQGSSYNIYNIDIGINLRTHKISDKGQTIVNRIQSQGKLTSDINVSFDNENTY